MCKCEKCGKVIDILYGSGRFCSEKCARSFSTKDVLHDEKKEAICTKCGKTCFIKKNASVKTAICEYCAVSKCAVCGKTISAFTKSGLCRDCNRRLPKSDEQKAKQSVAMKEKGYVRWKIHSSPSSAEILVASILNDNNVPFVSEYRVKNNRGYCYRLDFYIEKGNNKIDLEIDGEQHEYSDRKEHDCIRDEFLVSNGFMVYRIRWDDLNSQKGMDDFNKKILDFIKLYNSL